MSDRPGATRLRYRSAAGRWVLTATILGSGMAGLDATIVGIALPSIGRDFGVGVAALQWVFNAYTLTLAGLLLLGGALGDRYGRRRMFLVGTVWFAVASAACGAAPTAGLLIGARALQGAGAALLTPGSLAILQASFHPDDRAKAIGAWSGLSGIATAVGPFAGGWLIGAASWRWAFLVNLPVAAVVVVLAVSHVPESRDPDAAGRRPDALAALAVTGGLAGLTYGLIAAPAQGWASVRVLGALAAGAGLLAVFAVREGRDPAPLLPLKAFRSRQFSAANAVTFVVYAALSGALFLLPVVLQDSSGYSPMRAGAALLPLTLAMLTLSARFGALATRIGPRPLMTVGPLLIAAGMVLLIRLDRGGSYPAQVLPALAVFGLGLAVNVAPLTATALAAAPAEHAGMASAVNNDVARAGGLIAVAVLPAAAGITGAVYRQPVALLHGFHTAMLISAAACAAGGVLAGLTIRNPGRPAAPDGLRPPGGLQCPLDAPPVTAVGRR